MHIGETEAPRLKHAFRQMEGDRRTRGACLIHGLTLIETTLPVPLERAHKLKLRILEFIEHFTERGRPVRMASFGFNDGYLLIVANKQIAIGVMHPSLDDLEEIEKRAQAVLFDTINAVPPPPIPGERKASPLIDSQYTTMKPRLPDPSTRPIPRALEPMVHSRPQPGINGSKNRLPEPEPVFLWSDFRSKLESLLSKVMGDAQANRMVEREMAKSNIEDALEMSGAELRAFGRQVLEKIPNRVKRDALIEEMDALL